MDKLCLSVLKLSDRAAWTNFICPCHTEYQMEQQRRKTIQHYNSPCHAHFLTFSCYQELPLLRRERTRRWLIEAIIEAKEKYMYALWAYVIMPEHAHLLVYPLVQRYNISLFLKTLKQSVARKAKHYLQKNNPEWLNKLTVKRGTKKVFRFWQTGPGYDRNINSENELFEKIRYIHNNPVKRGLVLIPQDWRWSSAGWYNGEKDVVLAIDDFTLSSSFANKHEHGQTSLSMPPNY